MYIYTSIDIYINSERGEEKGKREKRKERVREGGREKRGGRRKNEREIHRYGCLTPREEKR